MNGSGMNVPVIERIFDRMETAPNRERELSPGPNPQIGTSDWRATVNGTRNPISPDVATLAAKVTEFWSNVTVGAPDECWPWTAYLEKDGYGQFFFGGRMRPAHELAVTFTTGERRAHGLDTCHSCNNPPCCNPAHLRFDTRKSNVSDMLAAGTHFANPGKLDRDKVRVIRERYASGATQLSLGEQYGVTNGLISQIVRGIRWATAPGPIQTGRSYNRG